MKMRERLLEQEPFKLCNGAMVSILLSLLLLFCPHKKKIVKMIMVKNCLIMILLK